MPLVPAVWGKDTPGWTWERMLACFTDCWLASLSPTNPCSWESPGLLLPKPIQSGMHDFPEVPSGSRGLGNSGNCTVTSDLSSGQVVLGPGI